MHKPLLALFVSASLMLVSEARSESQPQPQSQSPAQIAHEVTPVLSLYSGDALRAFVMGGLSYTFHLNRTFWVGADFIGGTLSVDKASGTGLKSGDKYILTNGVLYWNLPVRLGEGKGLRGDLYTSFGAGALWLGSEKLPVGIFGGGMLIHTSLAWMSIRFDLKGIFFAIDNPQGSDFNADMALNVGPSFVF